MRIVTPHNLPKNVLTNFRLILLLGRGGYLADTDLVKFSWRTKSKLCKQKLWAMGMELATL